MGLLTWAFIISNVALLPILEACTSCSSFEYTGLYCPVFTPKDDYDNVDVSVIPQMCQFLVDNGADVIVVATATGESPSLSNDDVKVALDNWIDVADDLNVPVLVTIGDAPLPELQDLARYAEEAGAAGLLIRPYKPNRLQNNDPLETSETDEAKDAEEYENTMEQVYYMQLISEAAPSLPVFYDDNPYNTGVFVDIVKLVTQVNKRILNFVGVKTNIFDNAVRLQLSFNLTEENLNVIVSQFVYLKTALRSGFDSFMLSEINTFPQEIRDIVDYAEDGDYEKSDEIFQNILDLTDAISEISYNFLAALKQATIYITGLELGDVFPPMRKLTDNQKDDLQSSLEEQGAEIVYTDSYEYCIQCQ